MGTRTIRIDQEVYEALRRERLPDERNFNGAIWRLLLPKEEPPGHGSGGSLPEPLDRLEFKLDTLARYRRREDHDPCGHLPGLMLALHLLAEVREEIAAIEAEHVPGRTYSSTEEEDGSTVIRDAESGDVMEIQTPYGQRIYTDAFVRRNDSEEGAP